MLKGKEIVLGVSGGIACYKSAELVRELTRRGAGVQVVMTKNAREFIRPLTFEALTGRPVIIDLFKPGQEAQMAHIKVARQADLLVIAPATANIMGKMAWGIADDPLTTILLATRSPVLIAPAMNAVMYENPVVQENLKRLRERGYFIVGPEAGELACGEEGYGRLAGVEAIVWEMEVILADKDLAGEDMVITAGPTQEPIDPIRIITNRSSGRMGYTLAMAAHRRGARVTLISGPTSLPDPHGVRLVRVNTALEMREEVLANLEEATALIMTAAVADFRPERVTEKKVKKDSFPASVPLVPNPDILKEVGERKGDMVLVGFAAESENLVENAKGKLIEKNLDLIVANDISGFASPENRVVIIDRDMQVKEFPLLPKEEVAEIILDRIKEMRLGRRGASSP